MTNPCVDCGGPLPVQRGRGRRRIRCETCAPPRKPKQPRQTNVVRMPKSSRSLVDATAAELDAAGVQDSALGQAAMILARRIDADEDNGSAVASMVKQWQDTLARALDGVSAGGSVLDLKARRDARRNA